MSEAAMSLAAPRALPLDQAHGLRRLFEGHRVRFVPVVSNPHIAFGGLMLERLCSAFGAFGARTLVVDTSERAAVVDSTALVDLALHIEALSHQLSYLAARGLPARCVDADGFTSAFLDLVGDAAGDVDVVLVHAPAADLCRLFSRHDPRHAGRREIYPLLLCDDRPSSVTHAYGALKLLAQRSDLIVHDVLLGASPDSPRATRIADQLAACAELYLQATVRHSLRIDPMGDLGGAGEATTPELRRWADQWLGTGRQGGLRAGAAARSDAALHVLN
jgi:flagellar biosynthesis protein FlhG